MALRQSGTTISLRPRRRKARRSISISLETRAPLSDREKRENFLDGIIGYAAYADYLDSRLAELSPGTSQYFTMKKRLDDLNQQQEERTIDFQWKVTNTITTDDYLSYKKGVLKNLDPGSQRFLDVSRDIDQAEKKLKTSKEIKLKNEINIIDSNLRNAEPLSEKQEKIMQEWIEKKKGLANWYLEVAQAETDPDLALKYYQDYVNTTDSINASIREEDAKRTSLRDRNEKIKHSRGDVTDEQYLDYTLERLSGEIDPSKQFSLIAQIDSLQNKIVQEKEAGIEVSKKELTADWGETNRSFKSELDKIDNLLASGLIDAEDYGREFYSLQSKYFSEANKIFESPLRDVEIINRVQDDIDARGVNKPFSDFSMKARAFLFHPNEKGEINAELYPGIRVVRSVSQEGKPSVSFQKRELVGKDFERKHIYHVPTGTWIEKREATDTLGKKTFFIPKFGQDDEGNIVEEFDVFDSDTKLYKKYDPSLKDPIREGKDVTFEYFEKDIRELRMTNFPEYEKVVKEKADQFGTVMTGAPTGIVKFIADPFGLGTFLDKTLGRGPFARPKKEPEVPTAIPPEKAEPRFEFKPPDIEREIKKVSEFFKGAIPALRGQEEPKRPTPAAEEAAISPDLKFDFEIGARGEDVKRTQEFLKDRGFFPKSPTGVFGPITQTAIKRFRQQFPEQFEVPEVSIPKVEVPEFEIPRFELPKIKLPKFEIPPIAAPKIEIPPITLPTASQVGGFLQRTGERAGGVLKRITGTAEDIFRKATAKLKQIF